MPVSKSVLKRDIESAGGSYNSDAGTGGKKTPGVSMSTLQDTIGKYRSSFDDARNNAAVSGWYGALDSIMKQTQKFNDGNIWTSDVTGGRMKQIDQLIGMHDNIAGQLTGGALAKFEEDYGNLVGYRDNANLRNEFFSKFRDQDDYDIRRSNFTGADTEYNAADWGMTDAQARELRQSLSGRLGERTTTLQSDLAAANTRVSEAETALGNAMRDSYRPNTGITKERIAELRQEFEDAKAEAQRLQGQYDQISGAASAYDLSGWKRTDNDYQLMQTAGFRNTDTSYRGGVTAKDIYDVDAANDRREEGTAARPTPIINDKLGLWMNASDTDKQMAGLSLDTHLTSGFIKGTGDEKGNEGTWSGLAREAATNHWDKLKPEEVQMYYYIYNNSGQQDAYAYLDSMSKTLAYRANQDDIEWAQGLSASEKAVLSLVSAPINVVGNITSFAQSAKDMISGNEVDENSRGYDLTRKVSNLRGVTADSVTDWVTGKTNGAIGKLAGNTYQAIMSGVDSAVGAGVFGSAYTPIMSAGAFSNRAIEMSKNGATPAQIAFGATAAGAIEWITENAGIDNIANRLPNIPKGELLSEIMRQMVSEGLEEGVSDVANLVVDSIVQAGNTDLDRDIRSLMMGEGLSYEEAQKKAFTQKAIDTMWSIYGGAISGGAMAGGSAALNSTLQAGDNYINDYRAGRDILKAGSADQLAEQARQLGNQKQAGKLTKAAENVAGITEDSFGNRRKVGKVAGQIARQAASEAQTSEIDAFKRMAKPIIDNDSSIRNKNRALDVLTRMQFDQPMVLGDRGYFKSLGGQKFLSKVVDAIGGDAAIRNSAIETQLNSFRTNTNVQYIRRGVNPTALANDSNFEVNRENQGVPVQKSTNEPITLDNMNRGEDGRLRFGDVVASDVAYGNYGQSVLYSIIDNSGVDTDTANEILAEVKSEDNADYLAAANAVREAFFRGRSNEVQDKARSRSRYAASISEALWNKMYEAGVMSANSEVAGKAAAIDNGTRKVAPGQLRYDGVDINSMELNDMQKSALDAAKALAAAGMNVTVYASTEAERQAGTKDNGTYNTATGEIGLDLNAGDGGEGLMAFALAHEFTHHMQELAPEEFQKLGKILMEEAENLGIDTTDLMEQSRAKVRRVYANQNPSESRINDLAYAEFVAEAMETIFTDTDALAMISDRIKAEDKTLWDKIVDFLRDIVDRLRRAYSGVDPDSDIAKAMRPAIQQSEAILDAFVNAAVSTIENVQLLGGSDMSNAPGDVQHSTRNNQKYMDNAMQFNEKRGDDAFVDSDVLAEAADVRSAIAAILTNPELQEALGMPPDITGKTFFSDSSYGGTEENTTICPRSMGAEALLDAVSDLIGRPLTVDEQIVVSQEMQGLTKNPECVYCYVATDRKAYREFLGEYIKQRDSVIQKYRAGSKDTSRTGKLYQDFLNGRKDTNNMYDRFKLWIDVENKGATALQASDLTSIERLTDLVANKYKGMDDLLKRQYVDAMKYAQSASWAKKREGYRAYDGHILKWKQGRINSLNSHYGLRMYSFSDFSPAFILENMQMITDAAVRGLKMLAYTKDLNFVKIFAKTGMNINVSCFGWQTNGTVMENNLQGAPWAEAQKLRQENPNVGVVFVAYNDQMVEWAMDQDWVDVVIPYHLVRTGTKVAEAFGFTNYTDISGDKKITSEWVADQDVKSITPVMHQNNKDMYLAACEANHLTPRFEKWIDHPGYMKLVNETRKSAAETPAVQPVFDQRSAEIALQDMQNEGGYYSPVYEMASHAMEIAEKLQSGSALKSGVLKSSRGYDYSKPFAQQIDDYQNGLIPTRDTLVVGGTPSVLQRIGFAALPMTYATGHLRDVIAGTKADHDFGVEILKQLPNAMKRPVAVITSRTQSGTSVVALLEMSHGGKKMIAAVRINGTGTENNVAIDSYAVTTVHKRGNAVALLRDAINDYISGNKSIFYIDKTKAARWVGSGLQLPSTLTTSNGFVANITDASAPVNPQITSNINTRQFRDWFGNSVVRNDDGSPMIVHHGTTAKFSSFNRGDIGIHVGTEQQAMERVRGEHGARVMQLYAAIENPLRAAFDFGDWHGKNVAGMLIETEQFDGFDNRDEIEERLSEIAAMDDSKSSDTALREYLQSLGYDGIVYENQFETDSQYGGEYQDSYIAFDPNQLKSIHNIGLYSKDTDNIYFSSRNAQMDDDIQIDDWLEDLDIDDLMAELEAELNAPAPKRARAKARVDEVNKVLKQWGLEFNGTKKAALTTQRIDEMLSPQNYGAGNDYSQGYITYMSPMDFLRLTAGGNTATTDDIEARANSHDSLDLTGVRASNPIYLDISVTSKGHAAVTDHDGRARMLQLGRAGFDQVPVILFETGAGHYGRQTEYGMKLKPQTFFNNSFISDTRSVTTDVMVPFSKGNRDLIINTFGEGSGADMLYSTRMSQETKAAIADYKAQTDAVSKAQQAVYDAERKQIIQEYNRKMKAMEASYSEEIEDIQRAFYSIAEKYEAKVNEAASAEVMVDELTAALQQEMDARKIDDQSRQLLESALRSVTAQYESRTDEAASLSQMVDELTAALDQEAAAHKITQQEKRLAESAFRAAAKKAEAKNMESAALAQQVDELTQALQQEVAAHDVDKETWEKEFSRLMKEYDASGHKVEALKQTVADQKAKAKAKVESRHKTEMRHKIQRTVNALNKMLLNPTKDSHVPDSMEASVRIAMEAINGALMSSKAADNSKRLSQYYAELTVLSRDPVKNADKIRAINDKVDNLTQRDANMKEALGKLRDQYHNLAEVGSDVYDKEIDDLIQGCYQMVGETAYNDLSLKQLELVHDAYTAVLSRIRKANKAFRENAKEGIQESVNRLLRELDSKGVKGKLQSASGKAWSQLWWNNLKPVYAFDRMGTDVMSSLYDGLRKGEDTWYRDVSSAKAFFLGEASKYGYDSWDFDRLYEFESATGEKFELNLEECMSLYAYSLRDQARDHLTKGGIVLNENTERIVRDKLGVKRTALYNDANAYNLTNEMIDRIGDNLTPEQRAFARSMQRYLSDVMGAKGNEVSLKLYDIRLFKEQFYWPLKSSEKYSATAKESNSQPTNKIKNSGFTKSVVQHASNPVELSGFMQTWAEHINKMSMYHAFTLPMEDFYRIYNWKSPSTEDSKTRSVQASLESTLGAGAVRYIDQFLLDLNGGLRADPREGIMKSMVNKFKKGAVFASASVTIQQPSAIGRAFSVISPAYFVGGRIENAGNAWEQCKQYAPVAGLKEMGRFDMDMGKSTEDYILSSKASISEKVDEALGWAPEMADQLTWTAIWEAAKRQTAAQNPGLKGEALLQKAGDLFTECITRTQVYDSVFSRSANMRSKSLAMNILTSFMAEPTTTANMVENALRQFARGNKRGASKAIASVVTSIILNSVLAAFVYAARDDDEDKSYWEKYLQQLTSGLISGANPATYIPFAKDVWSLCQGYDIERADMTLFSNAMTSVTKWVNVANAYDPDADEEKQAEWFKKMRDAAWNSADSVTAFFGIPLKNLRRDYDAAVNMFAESNWQEMSDITIKNAVMDAVQDEIPIWNKMPRDSKTDRLYDAILSGDQVYIRRQKANYPEAQKLDTAIVRGLRDHDPRILEAARAQYLDDDNAKRISLIREIVGEGYFTQNQVIKAINAEISKLESAGKPGKEWVEREQYLYTAADYIKAVTQGIGSADAMQREYIRARAENYIIDGKYTDRAAAELSARNNFAAGVYSEVKEQYAAGGLSAGDAVKALVRSGSKDQEDAEFSVHAWTVKAQVGADLGWSDTRYVKYDEIVRPAGITPQQYDQFYQATKGITGDDLNGDGKIDTNSKRDKIFAIIDRMPLTPAQKDALFYTLYTDPSQKTLQARPWAK